MLTYRTGQLTTEERAQRLAEMTGNASVHDEARWSRQRRARAEDEAEEAANQRKNAGIDTCSLHTLADLAYSSAYPTRDAQGCPGQGEDSTLTLRHLADWEEDRNLGTLRRYLIPADVSNTGADEERHAAKAAAFLKTATQETYGAGGEAASLADRVGRRKYYSERGSAH